MIRPLHKKWTMRATLIQKLLSLFPQQPTIIGTAKRQKGIKLEEDSLWRKLKENEVQWKRKKPKKGRARANLWNSSPFTMTKKMLWWSYSFKVFLGNSLALFLPRSEKFHVENLGIFNKINENNPVGKTFKWT